MSAFDTAQLTVARESVWDAITNWPDTSALKQYRNEEDPNLQSERGPSARVDLPCVSITPSKIDNKWIENRYMDYGYLVDISVYCGTLPELEGTLQQLWEAVVRSHPVGSDVPYTRTGCTKTPGQLGSTMELKRIGKGEKFLCWVGKMTLDLTTGNQPHGS